MPDLIPPVELSQYGRKLIVGIFLILFLILAIGIGGYIYFSETIPTHFGFSEKPDAYGSKVYLIIIAIILSLTLLFIMLIVKYRFTLINKYPYLINLPGFFTYIEKIEYSRRGYWYNLYFEKILWFNLFLAVYFLLIMILIFESARTGKMDVVGLILIMLMPFVAIVPFIVSLSILSKEMKREAQELGNPKLDRFL